MGKKKAQKCKPKANKDCKLKAKVDFRLPSMLVVIVLALLSSWKERPPHVCWPDIDSEEPICQVRQTRSLQ